MGRATRRKPEVAVISGPGAELCAARRVARDRRRAGAA